MIENENSDKIRARYGLVVRMRKNKMYVMNHKNQYDNDWIAIAKMRYYNEMVIFIRKSIVLRINIDR